MAVAVRNSPETATQSGGQSLAAASLLGAVYVVGALAVVAVGVPLLWEQGVAGWLRERLGSFVNVAGLVIVELFAVGVLWTLGLSMAGGATRPGLRAGVFTVAGFALAIAVVVSWLGRSGASPVADTIAVTVGGLLAFMAWRFVASPRFEDRMCTFEGQGWFTAAGYKPTQGRRVRRATMLGLLVLAGCGIWTLLSHRTLDTANPDWRLRVPFADMTFTLLPDVRYTVPLLLCALLFWLAYRVVHMPTFAEFLIATEGELNKVAWPTRRSLVQDTIVVLTTVVLMTLFLFFVDVAWGKILSNRYVGVLRIDSTKQKDGQGQAEKPPEW
jgi:preprotein translocase subunit SecE